MSNGVIVPEDEPRASKKAKKEATRIAEGNLREMKQSVLISIVRVLSFSGLWLPFSCCLPSFGPGIWLRPTAGTIYTVEEQNDIQTVLLSAVASSFATQMIRRWENPRGPSDPDADDSN